MKLAVYLLKQIIWPVFLVYLAFIILLYLLQNTFVYIPPSLSKIDISRLNSFVHQEVKTSDGLYIKGYFKAPEKGMPLILEFHGNGSHPAWEYPKFSRLIEKGYGVFLAEYRGYGGNVGTPNEDNLYKDGDAYMSWIIRNPDLKNTPLIVYGSSIGSGVAVDAAAKNPEIKALILEVPFNDLSDVASWHYPYIPFIKHIMKNKFPNEQKIINIAAPKLFILAGKDKIVPMQYGKKLIYSKRQIILMFIIRVQYK
ncbi:MAG: hypothetical protein DI586_06035 [Micavibrio aeruginosavorus]|uniref:Serine aminopeptidase S33 domain-containing protein n=1 Tax=Micavibrio aeruginosavorus TaxID=349221 RepID=A0A2W5HC64_9BACT|nr:MAG: hypothetical protein DI586_06035 [Micavibrio aeruginosavorus]